MRAMRPRLFEGKDDVMASAELASYLGDVARKTRVWLQDCEHAPGDAAADGVRTLHVEIRAESDLLGTLMFLQALERGDKLVRIDRLDISRAPRADEKDGETLSIAATIAGFAVGDSVRRRRSTQRSRRTAQAKRRLCHESARLARTPAMRVALGALGRGAWLMNAWALVRAFRVPTASADADHDRGEPRDDRRRGPKRPPADIQAAVDNDLFSSIGARRRRRIGCRARRRVDRQTSGGAVKPAVLGTAVATDGRSFATVQLGDGSPDARPRRRQDR